MLQLTFNHGLTVTGFRTTRPWPNGVASRRKLKTWVYLLLCLTRPCVHLPWLGMTCAHFGRGQICTQVHTTFSRLATWLDPSQSKLSDVRNLLLPNEIQEKSPLKWLFCDLRVRLATGTQHSIYLSSSRHYLRLLASPFGPGLTCNVTRNSHQTLIIKYGHLDENKSNSSNFLRWMV